jgi:hypothetical protein
LVGVPLLDLEPFDDLLPVNAKTPINKMIITANIAKNCLDMPVKLLIHFM